MESHEPHSEMYYVKIWALLLVLLIISICGPMLEIKILTLITAFGIAGVKAAIVASRFMHLNVEKKYIHYMLYFMLLMMVIFFAGVAPDVMRNEGTNWINAESKALIKEHANIMPYENPPEHH